jgi:predicted DsbA family dithiol-disulfide isomerase
MATTTGFEREGSDLILEKMGWRDRVAGDLQSGSNVGIRVVGLVTGAIAKV